MKIALLHDSVLPPKTYGGIERVVMLLARELTTLGHQVVIVSRKGSVVTDYEHVELPEHFPDYIKKLPQDLDFLHSHQPLQKYTPQIPYLITIHGNGKPGEIFDSNSSFVSRSHATNHSAKYFVYNAIDVDSYAFSEKKENSFSFLAKASWRVKNLKTAIQLARDTKTQLEVLGGTGTDSQWVKYHGLVGESEKNQILPRTKALLYPTNWDEPFGLAVLEALACGTPVIASSNGAMPELITPEVGFICKTYSEMLQATDKISHILPETCRNHVRQQFSAARMATDYLKLYEKIQAQGKLDHEPRSNFKKSSVTYLFKPTLVNKMLYQVRGKI